MHRRVGRVEASEKNYSIDRIDGRLEATAEHFVINAFIDF